MGGRPENTGFRGGLCWLVDPVVPVMGRQVQIRRGQAFSAMLSAVPLCDSAEAVGSALRGLLRA